MDEWVIDGLPISDGEWVPSTPCASSDVAIRSTVTDLIVTGYVVFKNLPTSDEGLEQGTVWNNGGFLCIAS